MSKIFKLVKPRGEEAETVESTSTQPATETDVIMLHMPRNDARVTDVSISEYVPRQGEQLQHSRWTSEKVQ